MNNQGNHIDPVGLLPKIFSGEATPAEQKVVSDWLSVNEENKKLYESFRQLWNITGPVKSDNINIDTEWMKMEKSISPALKLRWNTFNILKIAAAVILVSLLTFAGLQRAMFKTLRSSSTEIASYDLPDGSKVYLNAGSKIRFKRGFGATDRMLALKGEGFFEVMKSEVPFIVAAGNANVVVTGTKFNINAYSEKEEIKVTVTEGSLRLTISDEHTGGIDLKSGEAGVFNKTKNTISALPDISLNAVAWKTGILEFNNATLKDVTEILENTYHIPFIVDTAVMNCTITVRFDNQKADSVLNVLQSTLDVNIIRKGRKILITGSGC